MSSVKCVGGGSVARRVQPGSGGYVLAQPRQAFGGEPVDLPAWDPRLSVAAIAQQTTAGLLDNCPMSLVEPAGGRNCGPVIGWRCQPGWNGCPSSRSVAELAGELCGGKA